MKHGFWGWIRSYWRAIVGVALVLTGIALTVVISVTGSNSSPPPASTQGLLAFIAAVVQVAAAWVFAGVGRADPALARSSVSRLLRLAGRAIEARLLAEGIGEHKSVPTDLRKAAGQLSVHLSYLEEGFIESVEDWRSFHPGQVQEAEERASKDDE